MNQVLGRFLTDAEVRLRICFSHLEHGREHQIRKAYRNPIIRRRAIHDRMRFHRKLTSAVRVSIQIGRPIFTFDV